MFSTLKRATGFTDVVQEGNEVIIRGVSADVLRRDIKRIWSTSKIASAMFTKVTFSEIRIPAFFALEFEYILRIMRDTDGRNVVGKRFINRTLEGLRENTWLANIIKPVHPWMNFKAADQIIYSLLPHQLEFLKRYQDVKIQYGLKGMLLAAAAGGGKSLTGIALALTTKATKVIIICPKNALYKVWDKSLMEEMKTPQNPFVFERDRTIDPSKKYHIFHYEALEHAIGLAKQFANEDVCLILDESHNFNDIKSLRTERFISLSDMPCIKDVAWLSGTPIKAMGYEAIPLIRSIDPSFDQTCEQSFRKMYGKDAKRTLDILANRIGVISYIVPKAEFMADKPIEVPVPVKIPNGDKYTLTNLAKLMSTFVEERTKYYESIRPEAEAYFEQMMRIHEHSLRSPQEQEDYKVYRSHVDHLIRYGFKSAEDGQRAVMTNKYEKDKVIPSLPQVERNRFKDLKSVVKYPELKIRGECLGRILMKERMQCHVDMIRHIDFESIINGVDKKTIIFSSYVQVLEECNKELARRGFKPLTVHGDTNRDLPNIVTRFDKDPTINPLTATFQSLSVAVPLVMANGIIMLNSPWRSYEREQAIARAYRIGQDKTVYVHDIQLDTGGAVNISTRSIDIMEWSKNQVDSIVGVASNLQVSVEMNGLDSVITMDANEYLDDVLYDDARTYTEDPIGAYLDDAILRITAPLDTSPEPELDA